ncbi:MAG TPA: lytic transglycosylase domain-containing protein [Bryobacteraceae bacterium]|nr:lytic transglycosylase domain-containing protein [Bryobacteraceae bacterium]
MRLAVFFVACLPMVAGEYAVLTNGFRIHADSHRQDGDLMMLESNGGAISVPVAQVDRFEPEEAVPAPAPKPTVAAAPAPAPDARRLVSMAADAAALPRALVQSVAHAESGYRTDAVSSKGALGLMQLMPGTADLLKADPKVPAQNAWAGAVYLRSLLERYNGSVSRAVAAYNAGPGAVDKYHGIPPYAETQAYVRRVLAEYQKNARAAR